MPLTKKKKRPHYSAVVSSEQADRLAIIDATYAASLGSIASTLLQLVAEVGPEKYPDFMREVKKLEERLLSA